MDGRKTGSDVKTVLHTLLNFMAGVANIGISELGLIGDLLENQMNRCQVSNDNVKEANKWKYL